MTTPGTSQGHRTRTRALIISMIVIGTIMGVLALYPQWNLQSLRGAEYNGAFASCDLDEMAYASYIQALADGRPRKNDPYTGRDQSSASYQPESLFSIQFSTAYLVAGPISFANVGIWQAMPVISAVSAVSTAWILLLLLYSITRSVWWASAGTLVVLLGGALVSGLGVYSSLMETGVAYPFLPFLRRHIPSLSFPFMIGTLLFIWLGLNSRSKRCRIGYCVAAGLCFAVLVFSYFYVWTAMAAVLAAWFVFTIAFSRESIREDIKFFFGLGGLCVVPLVPYIYLLTRRNEMMDKAQLLVFTRELDLYRNVEMIGAGIVVLLLIGYFFFRDAINARAAALVSALAVSPILVFNQQVLTGRSLQPFHYEYYVSNYLVLIGACVLVILIAAALLKERQGVSAAVAILVGGAALGWGYLEIRETTRFWDGANIARDEAMPVNLRLRELGESNINEAKNLMTLNLDSLQGDSQPTIAPNAVLWARHQHAFVGLADWEENVTRYFKLIYYSDLDGEWLRKSLTSCGNIEACMAIFGWDRFNATLSSAARPLTKDDIDDAVSRYEAFVDGFTASDTVEHQVSYVIVRPTDRAQLINFQKWYTIDKGEVHGKYVLQRATLSEK